MSSPPSDHLTLMTSAPPAVDSTMAEQNEEDQRLIERAQQGDLEAFNDLVTRHERSVYNVCLRMLRDPDAAADATQDAFVRAWTNIDSFRGGVVRPWLLRIATNRTYDIIRSSARRPATSLDAMEYESEPEWSTHSAPAENPETFATRGELSGVLDTLLNELPDDQRLAIVLSDVQGYPYEDIAEVMNIAVGTVKSRISRGRSRLRAMLADHPQAMELFGRSQRSDNSERV